MRVLRVLELFCGTASFSRVARERGHDCITLDLDARFEPTLVMNILTFDSQKHLPKDWTPDIIWASPPCEGFSVGSIPTHWRGSTAKEHRPTSIKAVWSMRFVQKTVAIIDELEPSFFFIENPRGKLRKLNLIPYPRKTVCYCQYGDDRMKPTDIWTNLDWWVPKMCKRGNRDHIQARRGSLGGTQDRDARGFPQEGFLGSSVSNSSKSASDDYLRSKKT